MAATIVLGTRTRGRDARTARGSPTLCGSGDRDTWSLRGQKSGVVTTIDRMEELTDRIIEVLTSLGLSPCRSAGDHGGDLTVDIDTRDGVVTVPVDVKHRTNPLDPTEIARRRTSNGGIVAMSYVTPGAADRYRAARLHYVDGAGNAWLDFPGFHVDVQGRRPAMSATGRSHSLRPPAQTAAGVRVVFVLLTAPTTVSAPYERVADLANVSKGTVTRVMQNLTERGHIVTANGTRSLHGAPRLARQWADDYGRELAPRLMSATLSGPPPDWWQQDWDGVDGQLGGGLALISLGAPLKPAETVIYGVPPWRGLRRSGKLRRDGEPNVTLREQFWSPELNEKRYVAPLLAWADALVSNDPRDVESALGIASDPGQLL